MYSLLVVDDDIVSCCVYSRHECAYRDMQQQLTHNESTLAWFQQNYDHVDRQLNHTNNKLRELEQANEELNKDKDGLLTRYAL